MLIILFKGVRFSLGPSISSAHPDLPLAYKTGNLTVLHLHLNLQINQMFHPKLH